MYLILDGNISITSSSGIDKLCNLLFSIVNSIKSFSEYIPSFNSEEMVHDFNSLHQSIYKLTNLTHTECLLKRRIDISIQKKYDIIGSYELINNKTELYNFTAECVSPEAILLFIPRNDLSLILGRELNFYNNLVSLVENKIQYIVGKFKSFVYLLINNYKIPPEKTISPKKIKFSRNKLNAFSSGNNINKISKLNDNEKKSDMMFNYTNLKLYNYYQSMNNFKNELIKKKKIAEELLMNKKNSILKLYTPKKIENKFFNGIFLSTNLNNIDKKESRAQIHKSVDFSLQIKNPFSTYYSLNNSGYKPKIKEYQAFPMINNNRRKFINKFCK